MHILVDHLSAMSFLNPHPAKLIYLNFQQFEVCIATVVENCPYLLNLKVHTSK